MLLAPDQGNLATLVFFQAQPRQAHEQVCQPDQRHVVVPPEPRPRLVLRHPQVALAVLEEILHRCLVHTPRHHAQRRLRVAVADVVLDLGLPSSERRTSTQIGGPACGGGPPRPAPPRTRRPADRPPPRAPAAAPASAGRPAASAATEHTASRLGAAAAGPAPSRRDARRRVRRPDRGRCGDLHHVPLAQALQLVEQVPVHAVPLVGDDPIQADDPQHGDVADQLRGDLRLGPERQVLGESAPARRRAAAGPSNHDPWRYNW